MEEMESTEGGRPNKDNESENRGNESGGTGRCDKGGRGNDSEGEKRGEYMEIDGEGGGGR